ncbi:HdeD family acid-resistance protein [Candidatus Nitrosocosmicus arcticus]|uniref:HdeD family acid-resistance protein n=1 Tax=Candidatus Nitrosocosmicus arcticus TaxID=2035267 RepID=UPI001C9527E1|nr:DUF308 domain-containing protein [Candidatus Nitrosocosmicus arcticus]
MNILSIEKSPNWVRMAQIGLGLIILILSIIVLINPIIGSISIIVFLAFLLLFAGVEKIVSGIVLSGKSRFISIGLGIIVIIVSLIALVYPVEASVFVVLLLGIALLVDGISRIIHGIRDKEGRGWSKNFGIGVGALSIIFAIAVLVYPGIGLVLAGILIGIALLITSIQIISAGVTGEQRKPRAI